MLQITIPASELWDESKEEFISTKEQTLCLEHSLVSLSKWESKWHKAFLGKQPKSFEETLDYIKCMTITKNVDPDVYYHLTDANIKQINDYIDDPMSATVLPKRKAIGGPRDTVTSELIYYWMVALNIPFDECQKWHLNRLLTLIEICNIKNQPPKKLSKREIASRNTTLNAERRKRLGSRG